MNAKYVPVDAVLKRPKFLEATRMVSNYFLRNGIPKWVDMIKLKCAYQRFRLGYKPKKDNYKWAAKIKMEVKMTKFER